MQVRIELLMAFAHWHPRCSACLCDEHLIQCIHCVKRSRHIPSPAVAHWRSVCRGSSLGLKYDAVLQASLPRAAPHIRPSAPAEQFLADPPDASDTFRSPLLRGFDFSLFNQKHKPAVPVPAPLAARADSVSDRPTTGDTQPRTDGGRGPRSAEKADDATPNPPDRDFTTTAPAAMHERPNRLQPTGLPALADVQRGDAMHSTPSPLRRQRSSDALASPEHPIGPTHTAAPPAIQPTPSPADSLAAHPLPEIRTTKEALYSEPSKAKSSLGPSHAHRDMDADPNVPTDWGLSETDISYPDSCPPDQPMPDFKSTALFGDVNTVSVISIAEDHSANLPFPTKRPQQQPTEATPSAADASEPASGAPGGNSIAELHQKLTSGFTVATPANGGILRLSSENQSVSTPLQGGRKDGSEIEDSNCIQSELLPRVGAPTAAAPADTTAAAVSPAMEDPTSMAVGPSAGGCSGSTGQTAATCGGSPASRVFESPANEQAHEQGGSAHVLGVSATDQGTLNGEYCAAEAVPEVGADAGPASAPGTAPARDGGAATAQNDAGTLQVQAPRAKTAQGPQLLGPGAHTISWDENPGRHIAKGGSFERRNRVSADQATAMHVRCHV